MPRFTVSGLHRSIEITAVVSMQALPPRLHWSRRGSRVLTSSGLGLAGSALVTCGSRGIGGRLARPLLRYRDMIAGVTLIGFQYEVTDEESSVRGHIVGIGATLILLGLLANLPSPRAHFGCVG